GWSELPVDRPLCRAQQEHGRSNPATRACCEPMNESVTVSKIVNILSDTHSAATRGARASTAPSRGMASWSQSDPQETFLRWSCTDRHRDEHHTGGDHNTSGGTLFSL